MTPYLLLAAAVACAMAAVWFAWVARQRQRALKTARGDIRARETELAEMRRRDAAWQQERDTAAAALQEELRHLVEVRLPVAAAGGDVPPQLRAGFLGESVAGWLEKIPGHVVAVVHDREESLRRVTVAVGERVQAGAHRIQEAVAPLLDDPAVGEKAAEAALRVDHATTVQARLAQSLRIVCGAFPGQRWQEPLAVVDAVRSASGRIEAYQRVRVEGHHEVGVAAEVVEPLIHLLAELLSNAAACSPPAFEVRATVRLVQRGVVIEVDDSGAGMEDASLQAARARVSGERPVDLGALSEVPKLGLAVVGEYVRRHGFRVDLGESPYGGIRAVVLIPDRWVMPVPPRTLPGNERAMPAAPVEQRSAAEAGGAHKESRLPRRRSRRGEGGGQGEAEPGASAAGRRQVEQTPQEAGAWMNAFLTAGRGPGSEAEETTERSEQ
ncbi:ATP-binding protein [Streptomyces sp. MP131-18]|uniref:ATP-binding protein n=1 Tax=Streptomyces sp. MP131-18 TaxID=1857892 RepID=UPI00097C95CB|nr:ATP-binding protein [Streptomyces sp. MP131-18]ONK13215.1 Signal transduction histidine kinase [Streptomyces sp. MP131-18]